MVRKEEVALQSAFDEVIGEHVVKATSGGASKGVEGRIWRRRWRLVVIMMVVGVGIL